MGGAVVEGGSLLVVAREPATTVLLPLVLRFRGTVVCCRKRVIRVGGQEEKCVSRNRSWPWKQRSRQAAAPR